MLILSRKKDESIIIDGNIEVKILEIEDGKVRIGIEAPKNIDIFRKELYASIQEENKEAANLKLNIKEMNQLLKKKI
ncbi:MAG: carbon storage regulator CsrA [Tissierellia bacterium]|nr:carbon storage regulator CsrA [Tissierellia bacterium]